MWSLGYLYEGLADTTIEAWYYTMEGLANLSYVEVEHTWGMDGLEFVLSTQYTLQEIEGASASSLYGLGLETRYERFGLGLNVAYNEVSGDGIDNYFGGGPFFTSSEHITIADGGADATALLVSGCFDLSSIGLDGFNLTLNHLTLKPKGDEKIEEFDILVEYSYNENLSLRAVYSDVNDETTQVGSFTNLRIFVQYAF